MLEVRVLPREPGFALVAQWIEYVATDHGMRVRLLPGAPDIEVEEMRAVGLTASGISFPMILGQYINWEIASLARKRLGVRVPSAPPNFGSVVQA